MGGQSSHEQAYCGRTIEISYRTAHPHVTLHPPVEEKISFSQQGTLFNFPEKVITVAFGIRV